MEASLSLSHWIISNCHCHPPTSEAFEDKITKSEQPLYCYLAFFVPQEQANCTSFLFCLCMLSSDSEATMVFLTTFNQNAGCLPALIRHWERIRRRFWLGGRLSTWFAIAIKWCAHSGKRMHLPPGPCRKIRPGLLIAAVLKIVTLLSFENAHSCLRVWSFQTLVCWLQNYNANTSSVALW